MTNLDQLRAKVSPPVTWATLDKYVTDLFVPINRGECVTTVWPRMAGRRLWNKFIIENPKLFPVQIDHGKKFLLVYIEPLDLTEQSTVGYLRLLGNSVLDKLSFDEELSKIITPEEVALFRQDSIDYTRLLNELKSFFSKVIKSGFEIVLFLGEFDELEFVDSKFFNNLKSLWQYFQPNLHFVFLLMTNIENESAYYKYKDQIELLRQNIVYIPLLEDSDIEHVLSEMYEKYGLEGKEEYSKVLTELCGGHPYLLRIFTRILADWIKKGKSLQDFTNMAESHYEAVTVCRSIYESLGPNSKMIINSILSGKNAEDHDSLAHKLGIVKIDQKNKPKFFGKLFEKMIVSEMKSNKSIDHGKHSGKIEYNDNSGAITIGGEPIEDSFTRQEHELLVGFLKDPNKLKSRDEIGSILWGNNSFEKYSDWAIDQIISKLRKKLVSLGLGENSIYTIRGRGYKLNT